MLIQYLFEHPDLRAAPEHETGSAAISRLTTRYQQARERFENDSAFVERARRRVVDLQAGDPKTLAGWQERVDESKVYFNDVYQRLGVLLADDDAVGESFYNPMPRETADDLEQRGIAVRSDGALCVFFDDIRGPDGNPSPLIVQGTARIMSAAAGAGTSPSLLRSNAPREPRHGRTPWSVWTPASDTSRSDYQPRAH